MGAYEIVAPKSPPGRIAVQARDAASLFDKVSLHTKAAEEARSQGLRTISMHLPSCDQIAIDYFTLAKNEFTLAAAACARLAVEEGNDALIDKAAEILGHARSMRGHAAKVVKDAEIRDVVAGVVEARRGQTEPVAERY